MTDIVKYILENCGEKILFNIIHELNEFYKSLRPREDGIYAYSEGAADIFGYFECLASKINSEFITSSLLNDLFDELFDYEYPD